MSHRNSYGSTGNQSLLLPESRFSSVLQLEQPSGRSSSSIDLSRVDSPEDERRTVVLSTQSEAARRQGARQLIPKNLAVSSRPRNRHHTTVVTLPVSLQPTDLSWEDYDSDLGDGFLLRRNRRNKSYRAAVTSLNLDALPSELQTEMLTPLSEEKAGNQKQAQKSGRKRTLGRIRNRKQAGSFKDEPRFYQEIKERGLNASSLSTEDDEFSPTEPPEEDQGIVVKNYRAAYMTWSQLPQVKDLGILDIISPEERKRQEAIFEIITSEYSYQHSLSILVTHFKDSADLKKTMTTTEHHHLFSNISVIQDISKRFFEDLDTRHQKHPVIKDISDTVNKYATQHFKPYIVYCSNETFQQRTLQKLQSSNNAFRETLKQIEGSEACGGLPMISFLILPMQRITRLPLLLDTICQKTPKETAEYFAACWAFKAISKLVKHCNDGARRMERTEQMYTIQKQMEFGKIKPFPLVSSSRWLKKSGELAVYTDDLSIFRKAISIKSYYLFLFNDVLIVTKKKSEESYVVLYYATVDKVEVEEELTDSKLNLKLLMNPSSEQMILVAESKLDRARWVTALHDVKKSKSIANDDLPQYEATKAYMPKAPDELSLQQAELVIVLQEVEGWCHGERMRDGERGWFPASCATQITNRTAMENNIQRMERLRKETDV
ncbi:rho guanine nucleotide exchange factor 16-like isoform X2 [Sinocyclocheilus rhinocerous]|uniref:Rho guanine nucleotide exchange factor 16-like n=1 Tax=Sinocyclocheilus rhinocerous TaxID=307959 RepID=A0A673GHC5_9TELE|nr:PREDICTED: rho guanine nucleotide exchange factor 16-like isoform X1 [Sinocyclocheilus rhinocerous]XP_016419465.1 PREDICTED: rho guanine nucleotide exchange factor 16-like isoform X1 [Sinocyclocheilus rhinocerous]XP_016419466.1 PREDICTED: rho guanine nucleotide exchange factor 16-like isoform X1 [Sinocyclocheilus rhinocerous]XP_016419467.1 PREDICTED: rho guanine nucleotide exchange factor 16-like isoform X1 [Sinocyclocheilus rhinocerous]XP_016419469.1 PREDICTED: rho guanine nucleotide exchan